MKHITTAAPRAEAQHSCVQTEPATFRPVLRREVLYALRKARPRIGLSTGALAVLDVLLSFLPCRDARTGAETPVRTDMMLVIYASNSTICDRANGMCDRSLRRHIDHLVRAGLVARRDSVTRKRFPLRRQGRVVDAYGIDLRPLFLGADRIFDEARTADAEKEETRSLRAEALTLRSCLLEICDTLSAEDRSFVENAKTILRRVSLGLRGTRHILDRLRSLLGQTRQPCPLEADTPASAAPVTSPNIPYDQSSRTEHESGANGQIVRQEESQKTDTKYRRDKPGVQIETLWDRCPTLATFAPTPPRSDSELTDALYFLGRLIGLAEKTVMCALKTLGPVSTLEKLEYMASNAMTIQKPDLYLVGLL